MRRTLATMMMIIATLTASAHADQLGRDFLAESKQFQVEFAITQIRMWSFKPRGGEALAATIYHVCLTDKLKAGKPFIESRESCVSDTLITIAMVNQ